ncbi:hypothetical protein Scep_002730 [Stephania cephalantha]|uniref:Uncharacterized protein n=1 Tax=Stephania cephalantha TaxID=152367 RepID=A0AAP0LFL1_9MAGN
MRFLCSRACIALNNSAKLTLTKFLVFSSDEIVASNLVWGGYKDFLHNPESENLEPSNLTLFAIPSNLSNTPSLVSRVLHSLEARILD